MKPKSLAIIIIVSYLFTSCHSGGPAGVHHDHEGHNHETEHVHDAHGAHEHHDGEITFCQQKAQAVGLEVEQVTPQPFASIIRTGGKIMMLPGQEYTIVAPTEGIVTIVDPKIAEGAFIKEGAGIMMISGSSLQNGDPAVKAKLEYQAAEKEYLRAQKLIADNIISQKEFEQTALRYETAKAVWIGQEGKLTEKGVAVQSPATGYLGDILVGQGEYVSAGQPIAKVMKNNKMRLVAEVAESHFVQLKDIQTANFKTAYEASARSIKSLDGRLVSYARSTHGESSFIPVTFELTNDGTLLPGAYADVWLLTKQREDAIVVPVTALLEEQGSYFVFTKEEDEVYKKQEVKIGQNDGHRVEVLQGLSSGEYVVVKGAMSLKLSSASAAIPAHNHSH